MPNPRSTVQIAGHPIHPMLVPFVIGFYVGAFAADLAFAGTGDPFWARGAMWLIGAGIVMSVLAALAGFIDFVAEPAIRMLPAAWWHFGVNALVTLISVVDWCLRYVDGNEAGSHSYVWLTLLVTLLLLFSGWKGWEMVSKHHVGVAD